MGTKTTTNHLISRPPDFSPHVEVQYSFGFSIGNYSNGVVSQCEVEHCGGSVELSCQSQSLAGTTCTVIFRDNVQIGSPLTVRVSVRSINS